MYNVQHRKNYVLGAASETGTMIAPDIDPAQQAAAPVLPSVGGLLSGPVVWIAGGILAGLFLGKKAHRVRNAAIGGAVAFGAHHFMHGRAVVPVIIEEEGELEAEF